MYQNLYISLVPDPFAISVTICGLCDLPLKVCLDPLVVLLSSFYLPSSFFYLASFSISNTAWPILPTFWPASHSSVAIFSPSFNLLHRTFLPSFPTSFSDFCPFHIFLIDVSLISLCRWFSFPKGVQRKQESLNSCFFPRYLSQFICLHDLFYNLCAGTSQISISTPDVDSIV